MRKIVVTDTHFGARNNSIPFFEKQLAFFYEQFIPWAKKLCADEPCELIHCGDVFDNRSTISIYIAKKVQQLFSRLADEDLFNGHIVVIPGNHDYLQQKETDSYINSVDTILSTSDISLTIYENNTPVLGFDKCLYCNFNNFTVDKLRAFADKDVKSIFCHTDLERIDPEIKEMFPNARFVSGHIHNAWERKNLLNLGSTFSLNFSDYNQKKCVYLLSEDGTETIETLENTASIRFWRIDAETLKCADKLVEKFDAEDRFEVYLPSEDISNGVYSEELEKINTKFKYVTVLPITTETTNETKEAIDFENFDIRKVIRDMMDEDIKELYINKIENANE